MHIANAIPLKIPNEVILLKRSNINPPTKLPIGAPEKENTNIYFFLKTKWSYDKQLPINLSKLIYLSQ